ncbi:MAG: hypothetical protein AB1505_36175 [Candidatus Latescibacterota bacterium]
MDQSFGDTLKRDPLYLRLHDHPPASLEELNLLLQETIPKHLHDYHGIADLAFPPELVEGLTEDDVECARRTVDPVALAGRIGYRQMAVFHLMANLEAGLKPGPQPPLRHAGGDGRVRYQEITRKLRRLREAGVRVPAVFFLCLFAALLQGASTQPEPVQEKARRAADAQADWRALTSAVSSSSEPSRTCSPWSRSCACGGPWP